MFSDLEKKAAFNALSEAGFDFKDAVVIVKKASDDAHTGYWEGTDKMETDIAAKYGKTPDHQPGFWNTMKRRHHANNEVAKGTTLPGIGGTLLGAIAGYEAGAKLNPVIPMAAPFGWIMGATLGHILAVTPKRKENLAAMAERMHQKYKND